MRLAKFFRSVNFFAGCGIFFSSQFASGAAKLRKGRAIQKIQVIWLARDSRSARIVGNFYEN